MKNIPVILFCCCSLSAFSQQKSVFDSLYSTKTWRVYFASGQHTLDQTAQLVLDSIKTQFASIPERGMIRIAAHTDADGNTTYNESLASRRAGSVSKWLTQHQIPASAIVSVKAWGERAPEATNDTEQGRQQNRRVVIETGRTIPMTTWAGQVKDSKTGTGIQATLTFSTKTRQDTTLTDPRGYYSVQLPKDSVVRMDVIAKNYFFESVMVRTYGSKKLIDEAKQSPVIQLTPAALGAKASIKNLNFHPASPVLLPVSVLELPKVVKFMQINPELTIEIGGHINLPYPVKHNFKLAPGQTPEAYVMSLEDNSSKTLSVRRAKTVYDYLVKAGIDPARMSIKGYDNSQMLFPHAESLEEQEANRRVEIKITGKQ